MAKGRMINRTISIDPKFNSISMEAQWLYMRMLPFQDDYGRITGNVFELRLLTIPSWTFDNEWIVDKLQELRNFKLIAFELDQVIQFSGFSKNQKIGHRKAESLYPDIRKLAGKGQERSVKVEKGKNNLTEVNLLEAKTIKGKTNGVSNSDTHTLINVFGEKFTEEYKTEYHAKFGKEGKLFKNLENQYGHDAVVRGIIYFFDVYIKTDKWAGKNVDIGGMYALWNKMIATGNKKVQKDDALREWADG